MKSAFYLLSQDVNFEKVIKVSFVSMSHEGIRFPEISPN